MISPDSGGFVFSLAVFNEISNIDEASADPHEADVDMVGWRGRQGLHSIDVFRFAAYLGYKWERPRTGHFLLQISTRVYSFCELSTIWNVSGMTYALDTS